MSGNPNDSSAGRTVDHSWLLVAWGLPLLIGLGITVVTAGFGAMAIVVALMIGTVSTVLHLGGRGR